MNTNPPIVTTDPVYEAIARRLSGFGIVPESEQARMIKRAAKDGAAAIREQQKEVKRER